MNLLIRPIWLTLCQLIGFILLMEALIPYSSSTSTKEENNRTSRSCFDNLDRPKRRFVLFIVDALRSDFVLDRNSSYRLRSIEQFVEQRISINFRVRAQSPTVTLPRLKSILTGRFSSYWDVVLNYRSSRLNEDNILQRYRQQYRGHRMVFYGDDTWTKMFPETMFNQSEGIESFFVNDFDKVDESVERNVRRELESNQWNLMIVHLLGLDHIGHSIGARNRLVQSKLDQYDRLLVEIVSTLDPNDVLVLTSDHGMVDRGGHGGNSMEECIVPVSIVSKQLKEQMDERNNVDENSIFNQIDLTATLASLMETSFPSKSFGVVIDQVVRLFYDKQNRELGRCLIDENRRQVEENLLHSNLNIEFSSVREKLFSIFNRSDIRLIYLSFVVLFSVGILLFARVEIDQRLILVLPFTFVVLFLTENRFIQLALLVSSLNIALASRLVETNRPVSVRKSFSCNYLHYGRWLHRLSLFSTSFIEEEHLIIYFLASTYILIVLVESRSFDALSLIVLIRFSRSWNQTGNKWINQLDLADIVNSQDNRLVLFCIHLTVLSIFIYLLCSDQSRTTKFYFFYPVLILVYRWETVLSDQWRSSLAKIYYCTVLLLNVTGRLKLRESLVSILLLIHRVHQSPVILIHYYLERRIGREQSEWRLFLSEMSFFNLGNSNGLSTIDVSTGFVGLQGSNELLTGALIFLSIYGLSMNWLHPLSIERLSFDCLTDQFLMNSIYFISMTMQRQHLFLWTVFAPKLIYLFCQTSSLMFVYFIKIGSTDK